MSKHGKRHGKTRPPAPDTHAPQAAAPHAPPEGAEADPADQTSEVPAVADNPAAASAPAAERVAERAAEHTTERAAAPAATPAPAPAAPASLTAGQMLRAMREEAGVDAALVASGMKVSLEKIQALEEDRFEALPDLTFARGLASAISRAFGVDPAPVLERMPLPATGLRPVSPGLNQPFRSAEASPALIGAAASGIPKLVWWVAAALLLGALALWWLPPLPIQLNEPVPPAGGQAPHATEGGLVQESVPVAVPATPGSATAPDAAASAALPAASGTAAAAVAAVAPASGASAAADAVATTPAAAADKLLVFTATGESWVAVRDASGRQILSRTLSAGDTVGVSGETPLSVTVGRKEVVGVTVRGQPFNHRSLSSASVARFQVK